MEPFIFLKEYIGETDTYTVFKLYDDINNIGHVTIGISYDFIKTLRSSTKYINYECTIVSLFIEKEYRNKGYGTQLLNYVKQYCINKGLKRIKLDDMTDNFNMKNNIYLKFGFKYIDDGQPEMIFFI
jgi:GNAT superfamily N-acetyltransferase